MTNLLNTEPREQIIQGNTPIPLDSPDTIWVVKSGSIAIFAVTTVDGVPQGARRYLFDVPHRGDALFGIAQTLTGCSHTLIAVAYEETCLVSLGLENWFRRQTNGGQTCPPQKLVQLQKWFQRLASVFQETGIVLEKPTANQPLNLETLTQQLQHFHRQFLNCLSQLDQQNLETRTTQFQNRLQLNQKVSERAIEDLTALFRPQEAEFFQEGTPLLMAAGAVGRALGIPIRPPGRSENLKRVKDPLDAIARASGIRTRRVILSGPWWKADCGPLLAYLEDGEVPVALLPVGDNGYEIFAPEQRQRLPVTAQTAQQLSPIAYMFYRSLPAKVLKSVDILQFVMHGQLRNIFVIIFLGIVGTLLGMLTPQATGILIDNAIPDANKSLLLQIALGLAAVSFGKTMFECVQGTALTRVQTFTNAHTQAAIWDRVLKLRASFFRQYSSGDLQSRVSAINQIRQILSGRILRTLLASLFSLLNLGLLFLYNTQLALVAVAIALINIIVTTMFAIISRKQMQSQASVVGARLGFEVQLIDGISKLRVACAEERAFAYWAKKYRQQTKYTMNTLAIQDGVALFNTVMSTVSSIVIYWLAVMLIVQSQAQGIPGLSIGTFLAFNAAFGTFIAGATSLSNTAIDIMDISIMWKRAQPILKELPEVGRGKADPGLLQGGVKLDRVSFRYRKDAPLTLDRISIEAKPGEFIALVGPSGSGKSTIVRLLLGFEQVQDGTIFYDGQDLSGLDVTAVRRQLGVVLQNGRINSASIFENISGGALVTMDEAWEAARMAGFADDIEQMPMGMHTVISEGGTNLSGGQRQRLLIARALVLKPKVLIFDEATSALDNRTQAIVTKSLDQLQVTRIVIAHRLSTIRNANRIYVIASGQVVQQGTFEELMQQKGQFAELMARQVA
jgi:NHLM bacteriocin system ABC transporter ATP-binding protein